MTDYDLEPQPLYEREQERENKEERSLERSELKDHFKREEYQPHNAKELLILELVKN